MPAKFQAYSLKNLGEVYFWSSFSGKAIENHNCTVNAGTSQTLTGQNFGVKTSSIFKFGPLNVKISRISYFWYCYVICPILSPFAPFVLSLLGYFGLWRTKRGERPSNCIAVYWSLICWRKFCTHFDLHLLIKNLKGEVVLDKI